MSLRAPEQWQPAADDAEQMLSIVGNNKLAPTASEVRRRLAGVVEHAAAAFAARFRDLVEVPDDFPPRTAC